MPASGMYELVILLATEILGVGALDPSLREYRPKFGIDAAWVRSVAGDLKQTKKGVIALGGAAIQGWGWWSLR